MDKESLDKIRKVLEKHGLEEEVISEVEEELTEKTPADETTKDPDPAENNAPSEDASIKGEGEAPVSDDKPATSDDDASTDDNVPANDPTDDPADKAPVNDPEENTPAVDGAVDALPNGVEEVTPGADTPAEDASVQPEAGAEKIGELTAMLEEYKKANEGLLARVDALESALKESGIMADTPKGGNSVGLDDPTRTPDYHDDEADFDAMLDKFNKNNY